MPPGLEEAAWWLTRWVSGSMDDPDWDEGGTTFGAPRAFEILGGAVGTSRARATGVLWRHLMLPEREADGIVRRGELPPGPRFPMQSFTRSRDAALEFGAEDPCGDGKVPVLVSASTDAADILVGMADLRASRRPSIIQALGTVDNWRHQDEVIVRVASPLPLLSAEILPVAAPRYR